MKATNSTASKPIMDVLSEARSCIARGDIDQAELHIRKAIEMRHGKALRARDTVSRLTA